MPDLCSAAVMEAKKWLEEKKLTHSKDLDHGTGGTLNSVLLPPVSYFFIQCDFFFGEGGLLVMCNGACVFGCYMHAYACCCPIVCWIWIIVLNSVPVLAKFRLLVTRPVLVTSYKVSAVGILGTERNTGTGIFF